MKRKSSKRKINFLIAVLFVILVLAILAQFTLFNENKTGSSDQVNNQTTGQSQQKDNKQKQNEIIVDFGNGQKVSETLSSDTVYSALEKVAQKRGYKLITKQYKYGLMVEGINQVKNTSDKYWTYSVNGKAGLIAADRYLLTSGDTVLWQYTSQQ